MAQSFIGQKRLRKYYGKIREVLEMPNLIEVQKRSYERFLQMYAAPADREENVGLQAVFKSIFPINDFRKTCSLEFVEYTIGNWECKCSELHGIEHLQSECGFCGQRLVAPNARGGEVACTACGNLTPVKIPDCEQCGETVALSGSRGRASLGAAEALELLLGAGDLRVLARRRDGV